MMVKLNIHIAVWACALVLIGCGGSSGGGSGGSGGENNNSTHQPPITNLEFPKVAGTYAFITDAVLNISCTDGVETSVVSPMTSIYEIRQTESMLEFSGLDSGNFELSGISGFSSADITSTGGSIEHNGDFMLYVNIEVEKEQQLTYDELVWLLMTGELPNASNSLGFDMLIFYSWMGNIDGEGWSGTFEYMVIDFDLDFSCTYTTTFHGERVVGQNSPGVVIDGGNGMSEPWDPRILEFNPHEGMGIIFSDIRWIGSQN